MAAQQPQQFCVRWNSYHSNLQTIFPKLLSTENFADVTLACENRQLKCHKVVLSACSQYFERLLVQNPCKHPIIFMKDMRFSEMQSLVDFMYKGEVNVTQDDLPSLLKSAEALQIRGLCGSDSSGLTSESAKNLNNNYSPETPVSRNGQEQNATPRNSPTASATATSRGAAEDRLGPATAPATGNRQHNGGATSGNGVKQETVEEDGLYYGEMEDDENQEQDEDSEKPGSSLSQPSASKPYIRVKPESTLKLNQQPHAAEYMAKLSKMNPFEIQKEFAKYGFTTGMNAESIKSDYKTWIESNDQLEVELLKKNPQNGVFNIPAGITDLTAVTARKEPIKKTRRGRPPLFKDRLTDIGDSSFKSDLDQFLEGKEVSSSGLSRKDLEKVMMGKFNPNRRYSNEAMWAALMDVKRGGSIYRAAQTHKVPRKSLRNWMKRCHIKSSFPMPQQLKQFVENNKKQKEIYKKYHNYTPSDFEPNRPENMNQDDTAKLQESGYFDCDFEFGKHFLSVASSNNVSSEEDGNVPNFGENPAILETGGPLLGVNDTTKNDEVLNMSVKN